MRSSSDPSRVVLAHEHLALSFFRSPADPHSAFDWTAASLTAATPDVEEIWDMSNQTLGRDLHVLARLADLTGIRIVATTGHYLDRYHPDDTRGLSAADLARIWMADLDVRVGAVRIGLIGEIATGRGEVTPGELKALRAAALVQRETGVPIYTHTSYGTLARRQLDVLTAAGVDPERVVIGHADVFHPLAELLEVARSGASLGIDTVGKERWRGLDGELYHLPDRDRVALIGRLVAAGHESQIVLSSDLLYERDEPALNPSTFGRYGYAYITSAFLPMLREAGIAESTIELMAGDNPRRLLGRL